MGFMHTGARRSGLRYWSGRAIACGLTVAVLSAMGLVAGGAAASAVSPRARSTSMQATLSPLSLNVVGTVNLSQLAGPGAQRAAVRHSELRPAYHVTPLGLLHHTAASAGRAARSTAAVPSTSLDPIAGNLPGEVGFNGINALVNSSKNSPFLGGAGDVTPPDQGLGVGPSPAGTAVVEMVNDTLGIYSPSGKALIGALPAFQVFDQAPSTFLSDPRVYWDSTTRHWFLTMFAVPALPGSGVGPYGCNNGGAVENNCLAAQFIAVSTTTNPLGAYTVFWFDTSDGTNTTGTGGHIGDGCPCFGDYDQVGANSNGFYIATNEFCFNSSTACTTSVTGGFNGAVIYALPKSELIAAANGGSPPVVQRYGVDDATDPFGAYHLSPSTVTQGSASPNDEYFVESNANLPYDPTMTTSGLEVFALVGTSQLGQGAAPPLVMTTVATEAYTAAPPNAVQKSGPIPFGTLVGVGTTPAVQTDFNAVQEVTYASGDLYAELDTGLALGQQENAGLAWFVLKPTASASSITVKDGANGYVETTQDLMYPDISVNSKGQGYMAFSMAGPDMYPSAAYVTFDGTHGPGGVVHVAATGVLPIDDFSCYAFSSQTNTYSPAACRYGDYSMAQEYNGRTYMAAEYIAGGPRDVYTNWGTRIYGAPDAVAVSHKR